jgi:hypothetical protein
MQLIMINEPSVIITAFTIGWLCYAIVLRFGNPVRRQRPRRPANNPPVQLRRPALAHSQPRGWTSHSSSQQQDARGAAAAAKLATASEVSEMARRGSSWSQCRPSRWWKAVNKQQVLGCARQRPGHASHGHARSTLNNGQSILKKRSTACRPSSRTAVTVPAEQDHAGKG